MTKRRLTHMTWGQLLPGARIPSDQAANQEQQGTQIANQEPESF